MPGEIIPVDKLSIQKRTVASHSTRQTDLDKLGIELKMASDVDAKDTCNAIPYL